MTTNAHNIMFICTMTLKVALNQLCKAIKCPYIAIKLQANFFNNFANE